MEYVIIDNDDRVSGILEAWAEKHKYLGTLIF